MDDKNVKSLLIALVIGVVASLIMSIVMIGNIDHVDEDEMAAKIISQIGKLPTAEQVAALIPSVEMPEFTMPEIPEFKSDVKVKDLWEDLYSDEIEFVEDKAILVSLKEVGLEEVESGEDYTDIVDEDVLEDIMDFLEETLGIEIDEFVYVEIDNEEIESQVMVLGLDEDENSEAIVTFEIRVKYDLEEGVDDDFKNKIYVTSTVVLEETDFGADPIYEDKDVELVYSM